MGQDNGNSLLGLIVKGDHDCLIEFKKNYCNKLGTKVILGTLTTDLFIEGDHLTLKQV